MKLVKKIIGGIGLTLLLLIVLVIAVIVVLPVLFVIWLSESFFKLIRRDPRKPKFSPETYPENELTGEELYEEEVAKVYRKDLDRAKAFILKHTANVEATVNQKRQQKNIISKGDNSLAGGVDVSVEFTITLTSKKDSSLKVQLEYAYKAFRAKEADEFILYDVSDSDAYPELTVKIESPLNQNNLVFYLDSEESQWLAIAALNGDYKVSKFNQVWFYLKKFDIWAIPYKHSWQLIYRRKFRDKKVGRFTLH